MFKNKTGNTRGEGKKKKKKIARQYCALCHSLVVIKVTVIMLSYSDDKTNTAVVALEKLFK